MKSFIVVFVSLSCLIVAIKAAAVENVVELQKDFSQLIKNNSEQPKIKTDLSRNQDCIQPKETGRCFALFYRFAYDVEKRECVEFIYGGCGGNSNNFETKKDCELKCLENKEISSHTDGDAAEAVSNSTVSPDAENETTTVLSVSA